MRAARLYGVRDLRVEDLADPAPGPGEALIRIEACGVCPSDIRSYTGARAGSGGSRARRLRLWRRCDDRRGSGRFPTLARRLRGRWRGRGCRLAAKDRRHDAS